jgi:DNA-binding LacI/PurR family transcriptional regulator
MPETKKFTIYDVARQAGVSRQTVSRVINNRPDVAEVTRDRVHLIMKEMNYQPSAVAQSLSRNKSNVLGVVTAGLKYIGPSQTLSGITKKAEEIGFGLLLKELSSFTSNNIEPLLLWFKAHHVDGIIWAAPEIEDNRYWLDDLLPKIEIPIIFLTMDHRPDVSIVSFDNFNGAKIATLHLLELGKKHIGHISGPLDWWEARQRKLGWEAALLEAGIQPAESMCAEGNWSSKSGKAAIIELMKKFPEMDGVFAGNDQMALSVLQIACDQNIAIPDRLAVVGFDGIPESEYFSPSLSTVHQDLEKLGSIAVKELVHIIENRNLSNQENKVQYLKIHPKLIIRQSTQKR